MSQQKELSVILRYLSPQLCNKEKSDGRGSPKSPLDLPSYNLITRQGYQNHVPHNTQGSAKEHETWLSTSFSRDILFFLTMYNALISVPRRTTLNKASSNNNYFHKYEYVKATYGTVFSYKVFSCFSIGQVNTLATLSHWNSENQTVTTTFPFLTSDLNSYGPQFLLLTQYPQCWLTILSIKYKHLSSTFITSLP